MSLKSFLKEEANRRKALVEGQVVPETVRCVQCGICSFVCPIGIDVRRHAWKGQPVNDSHCLTCGECVARLPVGVLRFERTHLLQIRLQLQGKLEVTRYVIIGSGAAGIAAAEFIRRQDPKASILMLGEEMHGYYFSARV